ncbi:sulfite exporter TauE/SafE family protein [Devosia sp. XJ19-1]|uniref:Probable membrane transporter protein n=1 Tax=Devosia ureilytica TaxID=2952754 RepID=A0A9Q4AQ33_9HYPH|nr:sulfite exporter TauE/SafE family protein [Devosia ureilytica]MCP8884644.1 sulfite exporter TauE/SafE family protein [Devosia ureilytica]MCP8888274.1 sulfite exporter TauE/SafE family protein [Devosia ureilytica]
MFDPVFVTIAVIAVLVVGLSKAGLLGGLGVVGVPLLALVMAPRDAAGMMLPVLLCMDAVAIWMYRKECDWSLLRIMLPGAAIGTLVGWALWAVVSDAVVLLMVGVVTLLFVLDAILPLRKKLEGLPPSKPWGVLWGGIAGFTSFISHTGGPPFQIYVLPRRLPPAVYAGTTAFFFAIVNTAKLVPYYFLGQLNVHNLTLSAALAPVGVLGVFIGIYLVRRIDARLFYRIAYWLVFILALQLIWEGSSRLLAG